MNEFNGENDYVTLEDIQRHSDESRWWEVDTATEDAASHAEIKREKYIYNVGEISQTVDEVEQRILSHDLSFFGRLVCVCYGMAWFTCQHK